MVEFSAWYYDEIKQLLGAILAEKVGATNIEFHHARFLSYEPKDEHVDFIITKAAFHNLPDFWKTVGLTRI
ncbi:MAG: class I SAM-dependent methyltransferase [Calothrix sp. FI2-JRJ7]|jgi:hypothetical protein|nr:class I SAM-dependent methyltransferase [Calothrix sp. FI2-JRJ7]